MCFTSYYLVLVLLILLIFILLAGLINEGVVQCRTEDGCGGGKKAEEETKEESNRSRRKQKEAEIRDNMWGINYRVRNDNREEERRDREKGRGGGTEEYEKERRWISHRPHSRCRRIGHCEALSPW